MFASFYNFNNITVGKTKLWYVHVHVELQIKF